jgi:hypothetical protein
VWLDFDAKGGCYTKKHEQRAMSRPTECLLRQAIKRDGAIRESEDTMMSPIGAMYKEGLQDCGDLLNMMWARSPQAEEASTIAARVEGR